MKITFIADTHYYSKSLGVSGRAYELRSGSDQKCLGETEEIIDSAFEKIAQSDTDAVVILGDLSNDGEKVSHEEFRQKLYTLQESKNVYIITATHDWCCDENPRRFVGDEVFGDVEVMKSDELYDFYKDFGPRRAIDSFVTKIGTLCYTVELCKGVRLLLLNDDKNENDHAGYTEDCWQWIEKQIENAKKDNCLLIGAQHHLLFPHFSPLIEGGSTCVENREYVASRFADAGLKYMFVGHSHIQSTTKFTSDSCNEITQVNVASLVGYPAPIVNVEVNSDNTLTYNVEHLEHFYIGSRKIDAQRYLAKHSCDIIFRILEYKSKDDFEQRLSALGLDGKRLSHIWFLAGHILKKLNTCFVWDVYKVLKALGLAKSISKSDALEYRYKPLKELIGEIWLSVLDGACEVHGRDSSYYRVVHGALSVLPTVFKNNDDIKELPNAVDVILTGGEINNQHATI